MGKLLVSEPISGGLLLSYKCTSECKHCMYACSPKWCADWISEKDATEILTQLSSRLPKPSLFYSNRIGINYGLHFTGGEPFLNFDLLLKVTKIASELKIPSTFVETNCYWCTNDEITQDRLRQLKNAGLDGLLISVNPFILEHVPFERTERAIRISKEIFGGNVIVYQEFFYNDFKRLKLKNTLSFEEYLKKTNLSSLYRNIELIPMGRAAYKLGYLYSRYPAEYFFNESCKEELTRDWHIHIDNYGNYITGYCGGISLGNGRNLDSICKGIDLDDYPILEALTIRMEKLYKLGKGFGYKDLPEMYISKCHLCVDIRKHLIKQTAEFKELKPREFYSHLE